MDGRGIDGQQIDGRRSGSWPLCFQPRLPGAAHWTVPFVANAGLRVAPRFEILSGLFDPYAYAFPRIRKSKRITARRYLPLTAQGTVWYRIAPSRLRAFAPSRLRAFAPSRLRAFAPSRLRAFAPSRLRAFAPSRLYDGTVTRHQALPVALTGTLSSERCYRPAAGPCRRCVPVRAGFRRSPIPVSSSLPPLRLRPPCPASGRVGVLCLSLDPASGVLNHENRQIETPALGKHPRLVDGARRMRRQQRRRQSHRG